MPCRQLLTGGALSQRARGPSLPPATRPPAMRGRSSAPGVMLFGRCKLEAGEKREINKSRRRFRDYLTLLGLAPVAPQPRIKTNMTKFDEDQPKQQQQQQQRRRRHCRRQTANIRAASNLRQARGGYRHEE
ncbi:hypothetical protein H106_00640 [Trichophyton rubrum CBS 735.88]|nr:hypothetical protein H106_00640 [Trichophyton rubrum CBS 735.88]